MIRRRGAFRETKVGKIYAYVMLVIFVLFSPVALMPFHMAAHAHSPTAQWIMIGINVAIYIFGFIGLRQRWLILKQDLRN